MGFQAGAMGSGDREPVALTRVIHMRPLLEHGRLCRACCETP